jgi:hypothetical protein
MAIVLIEQITSRDTSLSGSDYNYVQEYLVTGTKSPDEAVSALAGVTQPLVIGTRKLYINSVSAKLLSYQNETCTGEIIWNTRGRISHDNTAATEFVTLEMAGESTHISHVSAPADATHYYDDLGTGIGLNGDGTLDGVDVLEPTEALQIKIYKTPSTINATYRTTLRNLYMTVNNATWKGYGAGNLLFIGVAYGEQRDSLMSVTFRFLARPSVTITPAIIGNDNGEANPPNITKRGWDYYWIVRGASFDFSPGIGIADIKAGVKSAHIARVYRAANFATLPLDSTKLFPSD